MEQNPPQDQQNNFQNPVNYGQPVPETPQLNSPVSNYGNESSKKTLLLVGVIIVTVTVLSIFSLMNLNKRSTIIQSKSIEKSTKVSVTATPTVEPGPEETELNGIDIPAPDQDVQGLSTTAEGL